jgi:signal transduction histidine kinase
MDGYDDASGDAADIALRYGWRSSIAAPIVVEGRVWGVILVATRGLTPFPARAEERLAAFTDLIATAIANAEGKSELAASRRRIVTAADEARRRIERDLHDGIQQRLIALRFDVQRLGGDVSEQDTTTGAGLERLDVELESVLEELREVSRGIHPPLLSRGGLLAPLRTLARRSPIPVELRVVTEPRPPEAVEVAAYYAISEALTNAIKYSQASSISIAVEVSGDTLRILVRDDGVGGASPGRGSGLTGLIDRVGALDGKLDLESPDGEGTMIEIQLPVHTPVG